MTSIFNVKLNSIRKKLFESFFNIQGTWIVIFFSILLTITTFSLFRWSNAKIQDKAEKSIQTLLKNESLIANTYALSKSILDLEKLDVIRCSEVVEGLTNGRKYYSTLEQDMCYHNFVLRFLSEFSFEAKSVNNYTYLITLQMNIPWQSIILEIIIYLLNGLGTLLFIKYIRKNQELVIVRAKAIEIEKSERKMLLDKAIQIRHDVQAPIMAMKQILTILKDMDPTLRDVFSRSIDRTQELFNQLNASTNVQKKIPCSVNKILREIISEKKISWSGNGVELHFTSTIESGSDLVMANEMEFRRLASNILNNAAEACADRSIKKIQVHITKKENKIEISFIDSGGGIPQHIIEKLGQKGFSYGKETHQSSGSGLGLFHAMTTIRSWNGELLITSQVNIGTTLTIILPIC